jgi:Cytochrome c7 and related cytochrome c/Class III cytochrome C family
MAQIFGPRSNTLARLSVYGVFGVLALFVVGLAIYSRSPYPAFAQKSPDQPVPFSHQLHAGGLKIDCRYCHAGVESSAVAGIPPTQTCMTCHSQIKTDSPNLAPVRESWQTGQPIAWNRVHDLPDFVYFNHSIHIAKGVGCSTCHGQVDQMAKVQQVEPLTMGWCLNCHRAPEQYIRPAAEVFNMEWQPPADQLDQGRKLIQDYHIQVSNLQNCSICHR